MEMERWLEEDCTKASAKALAASFVIGCGLQGAGFESSGFAGLRLKSIPETPKLDSLRA